MKIMNYIKGRDKATINKVEIPGGGDFFRVSYKDKDRGSIVSRYLGNFWEAETVLLKKGYHGEKEQEYKGVIIRWRERGIHNVADTLYKDGYYEYLPPFPGTIFYWAATIPEAQAEIDRLERFSNSL